MTLYIYIYILAIQHFIWLSAHHYVGFVTQQSSYISLYIYMYTTTVSLNNFQDMYLSYPLSMMGRSFSQLCIHHGFWNSPKSHGDVLSQALDPSRWACGWRVGMRLKWLSLTQWNQHIIVIVIHSLSYSIIVYYYFSSSIGNLEL